MGVAFLRVPGHPKRRQERIQCIERPGTVDFAANCLALLPSQGISALLPTRPGL